MPHNWLAFKTTFLIPLISAVVCMILMVFIITPFGGWVNNLIKSLLQAAGSTGQYVYALVLSATTAFDLGGPVNKAAGFVALGFTTEKVLPVTARCLAIVIPSFGLGLTTLLDKKLVGRRVYDKQFYQGGKTAIFLAFMGISEGAIPFALERPAFTIPLYVVGACVGSMTAIALGAVQWFPESAIWAWPLVKGIIPYITGLIVGSLFIALINIYNRNKLIKEGKLIVNE
jgi:fructose-specific PTS system IIC-like component